MLPDTDPDAIGPAPLVPPADLGPPDLGTAQMQSPTEQPKVTPSGLPWRQRRPAPEEPTLALPNPALGTTSLASERPTTSDLWGEDDTDGAGRLPTVHRDPDVTRTLMTSYRSGTLRGRTEAARLAESAPDPTDPGATDHPASTPSTTESPPLTEAAHEVRPTGEGG
jgi:hypothetical protein